MPPVLSPPKVSLCHKESISLCGGESYLQLVASFFVLILMSLALTLANGSYLLVDCSSGRWNFVRNLSLSRSKHILDSWPADECDCYTSHVAGYTTVHLKIILQCLTSVTLTLSKNSNEQWCNPITFLICYYLQTLPLYR